jgi:lysophospholipase L1-like esterase
MKIWNGWALLGLFVLAVGLRAEPVRVACLGDSITFGARAPDPATQSYPVQLQALLGSGYVVKNFGRSGATMWHGSPNHAAQQVPAARDFKPDAVVVMFGINDTRDAGVDYWHHFGEFDADATAILNELLAGPKPPRILLCLPTGGITDMPGMTSERTAVLTERIPRLDAVRTKLRALAARYASRGVQLVDMDAATAGRRELYYEDGVHFNPRGYRHIAETLRPYVEHGASGVAKLPGRYLFLDPAILVRTEGAALKVNPASRRETVIVTDKPWENHLISFFLTVREEAGKLRMWYVCRDGYGTPDSQANLAYAESSDGIHWVKPELGIYEYHGSKANNLLGLHSLEGVVFQDPNQPADQRYIYVSTGKLGGTAKSDGGPTGIYRHYSPDGLHWQRDAAPLIKSGSDTQNVVWWDELRKEYVVIVRGWNANPSRRKVSRIALPDLTTPFATVPDGTGYGRYFHNEIPTILECDDQDPTRADIYNMAAQPYALDPHWYVAFPTFLRRSAATDAPDWKGRHMGPAEVQFAGSHDSVAWHRYDRAAYAAPGLPSPAKKNMTFMGAGLIVRGEEIWQYGTEFESVHGDIEARAKKSDGSVVRYVQRVDGFVSLDTGNTLGVARTVPVKITGAQLLLNLNTGALGEMRVALVGSDGQPLPGFTADDCVPLEYNGTGVKVTWKGQPDLSALLGREISMEFRSTRTKLYSFRFE